LKDLTITDGLICLRCGYDLRTQAKDANCPECGLEIEKSYQAWTVFHNPQNLRRIARGMILFVIAGAVGFINWHEIRIFNVPGKEIFELTLYRLYRQQHVLYITIDRLSLIMAVLGVLLMTSPTGSSLKKFRLAGRWLTIVGFAMS
jgi:uncharacterized membrane protein